MTHVIPFDLLSAYLSLLNACVPSWQRPWRLRAILRAEIVGVGLSSPHLNLPITPIREGVLLEYSTLVALVVLLILRRHLSTGGCVSLKSF